MSDCNICFILHSFTSFFPQQELILSPYLLTSLFLLKEWVHSGKPAGSITCTHEWGVIKLTKLTKLTKQTFINYLENVRYDEAVWFIPQSLVWWSQMQASCIIPDIFQITDEDLDFYERIFNLNIGFKGTSRGPEALESHLKYTSKTISWLIIFKVVDARSVVTQDTWSLYSTIFRERLWNVQMPNSMTARAKMEK